MSINKGFALIGHPPTIESLQKYFEFFKPEYKEKRINNDLLVSLFHWMPPFKAFDISTKHSARANDVSGIFVLSTFFPQMLAQSWKKVVTKVKEAVSLCEKERTRVTALGGFASIVDGHAGQIVAKAAEKMAVTNGSTLTTAFTVKGIEKICSLVDLDLSNAKLAIVGATGSIGKTCARYFRGRVGHMILTSRKMKKLTDSFPAETWNKDGRVELSTDNDSSVKKADIIICVTSSTRSLFEAVSFKSGAIVCDVGFPKTISENCADRSDILVYMGGLGKMPWSIEEAPIWGLNSTKLVYGCFAESMVIDIEECYQFATVGTDDINLDRVELLYELARKHGFDVSPFFNSKKYFTEYDYQRIKDIIRQSSLAPIFN